MSIRYQWMADNQLEFIKKLIAKKSTDFIHIGTIVESMRFDQFEKEYVSLDIDIQFEGISDGIDGYGKITLIMESNKLWDI